MHLLLILLSLLFPKPQPCVELQAASTYLVSYAKRSLKADNFDHQQYYAERALKALDKSAALLEACGCAEAEDPLYEGRNYLVQALQAEKWEEGRFFSQRSLEAGREFMLALDRCAADETQE